MTLMLKTGYLDKPFLTLALLGACGCAFLPTEGASQVVSVEISLDDLRFHGPAKLLLDSLRARRTGEVGFVLGLTERFEPGQRRFIESLADSTTLQAVDMDGRVDCENRPSKTSPCEVTLPETVVWLTAFQQPQENQLRIGFTLITGANGSGHYAEFERDAMGAWKLLRIKTRWVS